MKIDFRLIVILLFIIGISNGLIAQHTISGTVHNESGDELAYASVFLENTTYGAVVAEDGSFEINDIEAGNYSLKVSFLSYVSYVEDLEIDKDKIFSIVMKGNAFQLESLELIANRVTKDNPIAHSDISREEIEANNFGKDIPVLLQQTPSLVVSSDAGNGVGYTSIRIRGFDITRINVNINGVPLNDAESQAVFFVDIPDLLSSTEDIQIQRGVGSSTNGSGAFGASISLNTKRTHIKPYIDLGIGYGSYNTKHLSASVGTGLMNDKYSIDFRYSLVDSDGYIDRASSQLNSYYVSASKLTNSSSLRFISFSGHEKTYQAWYGTPKEKLYGTEEELKDHYNRNKGSIYKTEIDSSNLFSSDRKYNYYTYKNQVDDYIQTHYQLHYAKQMNEKLSLKSGLYSSIGRGFYEEYKSNDKFSNYFLSDIKVGEDFISRGDIVRRRSLSNILYGSFLNMVYELNHSQELDFGLSASTYTGDHFGKVILSKAHGDIDIDKKYYESVGDKKEASAYMKYNWKPNDSWGIFLDFQYRFVNYKTKGTDNDQQQFDVNHSFNFLNPKLGISYNLTSKSSLNLFAGISNREPSRNDFVDVIKDTAPKHEQIHDFELSYRYRTSKVNLEMNAYYMNYINQLVLRGDLNDVGASIRVNVGNSYRTGIETSIGIQWAENFKSNLNISISDSRIKLYKEYIYDYGINGSILTDYKNTSIAFSPEMVSNLRLTYLISKDIRINWDTRYVAKQYIDNTSNEDKTIPSYMVSDIIASYSYKNNKIKNLSFSLKLANVFNKLYVNNAYTYSYIWGEKITETFYYPQAERNISLSMNLKF